MESSCWSLFKGKLDSRSKGGLIPNKRGSFEAGGRYELWVGHRVLDSTVEPEYCEHLHSHHKHQANINEEKRIHRSPNVIPAMN